MKDNVGKVRRNEREEIVWKVIRSKEKTSLPAASPDDQTTFPLF